MKEAASTAFWKSWLFLALTLAFTALTIYDYKRAAYGQALADGIITGFEFGFFLMSFMYQMVLWQHHKLIDLQHKFINEMYLYIMFINGSERPRKEKNNGRNDTGGQEGSFYKPKKVRK